MKHANTTWLAGFVALAIAWGSTAALAQHQHGAQKAVAPASAAKPARKASRSREPRRGGRTWHWLSKPARSISVKCR